ncbi:MAG: hypothetical protein WDK96_03125 [Candidatus Paceibacterota bacterium]|jgi:hypothetical protein
MDEIKPYIIPFFVILAFAIFWFISRDKSPKKESDSLKPKNEEPKPEKKKEEKTKDEKKKDAKKIPIGKIIVAILCFLVINVLVAKVWPERWAKITGDGYYVGSLNFWIFELSLITLMLVYIYSYNINVFWLLIALIILFIFGTGGFSCNTTKEKDYSDGTKEFTFYVPVDGWSDPITIYEQYDFSFNLGGRSTNIKTPSDTIIKFEKIPGKTTNIGKFLHPGSFYFQSLCGKGFTASVKTWPKKLK